MVRSRLEESPHYRVPTWERPLGITTKRKPRRLMMTDPSILDGQTDYGLLKTPQVVQLEPAEPQLEESSRSPLFKRGTVLYAAVYKNERPVLPFNEVQADDLAKEVLDFDQNLQISERSMGIGKNGREVIKRIGKSSYGAFVEVLLHKKDGDGNDIIEKRFVRFQDRALAKNNSKLRFRKANQ